MKMSNSIQGLGLREALLWENIIPTTALFPEYKMMGVKRMEEMETGREVPARLQ